MKILIVDDDRTTHVVLSAILEKQEHEIYAAYDGTSALEMFECIHPSIVLMDVMMPRMGGLDAAKEIKRLSGERYVPIIFITSNNAAGSMRRYIECGGDDFIFKPFDAELVQAKIKSMARIFSLYEKLLAQRVNLDNELNIARHVFDIIADKARLDLPFLNHRTIPAARFSSDLLLCKPTPTGGVNFLLVDFGGYGLSAAMSSIPLLDIFYSMTNKGFLAGDIIVELNNKLKAILPENMFCAAVIGSIDSEKTSVTIWNGGMPDVLITTNEGEIINSVPSSHLALGVSSNESFNRSTAISEIDAHSRLYIMSDGLLKEKNSKNEKFDRKQLEIILAANKPNLIERIFEKISQNVDEANQSDDITFAEIDVSVIEDISRVDEKVALPSKMPSTWSAAFSLDAHSLRDLNVVPMILNLVMEVQAPVKHRERLFTIVSELFNNSLEHGVLKLDSIMKLDHNGFIAYYEARMSRLALLTDATIKLNLNHEPHDKGGRLKITVEDTGAGFDYKAPSKRMDDNITPSGRGVSLVKSLCTSVEYSGRGNIVTVVYDWS